MYAKDCMNSLEMLEILCDRVATEIEFYNKAIASGDSENRKKQHIRVYTLRSVLTEMHVRSHVIINESGQFECIGFEVSGHLYGFARCGRYDDNGVYQGTFFRFWQDIPDFAGMSLTEDFTTF